MKGYYFLVVAVLYSYALHSQTFIQGALGFNIYENSIDHHAVKGSKGVDIQIGKFVSNKKMRSVSFNYRYNRTHDFGTYNYITHNQGVNTYHYDERLVTSSVISIGYERKKCFANTEFDDKWQYYNIISYLYSVVKVKDEFTTPGVDKSKVPDFKDLSGTHKSYFDVNLGLGMARKFYRKTYAFVEVRYFTPLFNFSTPYSGRGIKTNFGIRYFIR
jgi:hypothetical protein